MISSRAINWAKKNGQKNSKPANANQRPVMIRKRLPLPKCLKCVRENLHASLDWIDPDKAEKALQEFLTALSKLHYADSGKAMLGKLEDFPTATIQKMF